MTNAWWRTWLCILGLWTILVAGCASGAVPRSTSDAIAAPGSAAQPPGTLPGSRPPSGLCGGFSRLPSLRIAATFRAASAFECQQEDHLIPGRGQWEVEIERKATQGLKPLVAALRRPDQGPPPTVCTAVGSVTPQIALQDGGGKLVRPIIPSEQCDQPQTQTLDTIQDLEWTTISQQLVSQLETQAEVTSGCPSEYKDLFDLYSLEHLHSLATSPAVAGNPASLTICRCRDEPSTNGAGKIYGIQFRSGRFVGGGTVNGSTESALLKGISGGRASVGCSQEHQEVAVILGADGQANTAVELDGCDRVLRTSIVMTAGIARESDGIGQATPQAVALIERIATPAG